MLFNSIEFILIFLPLVISLYYLIPAQIYNFKKYLLIISSLFFYSYWNPIYLPLLLGSIVFNFFIGRQIQKRRDHALLFLGIIFNVSLLAYFKYFNFFIENLESFFDYSWNFKEVVLPLAISFFTFQQIAYLIDTKNTQSLNYSFTDYSLFICFFPQLIAGPIVHHTEFLTNLDHNIKEVNLKRISQGILFFTFGLFKKVIIADSLSQKASELFDTNTDVFYNSLNIIPGIFAYSSQIYFDFSGYSDMAIGLGLIFGITLPFNFDSPYKSQNLISFWKRWHISLSSFLKNYIYIPLGGNRRGISKKYLYIFFTMLIGGIWHGSSWNFFIWGSMHGLFLIFNHSLVQWFPFHLSKFFKTSITFILVSLSWIYFRSPDITTANQILFNILNYDQGSILLFDIGDFLILGTSLFIIFKYDNTQEIIFKSECFLNRRIIYSSKLAIFTFIIFAFCLYNLIDIPNEFLYFQF